MTPNSESLHANFNNHCGFFSDFELKKLLCSLNISKSIQVLSTVIIVWHVIVQFTFYDYFRFWLESVTYLVMHKNKWKLKTSWFYSVSPKKTIHSQWCHLTGAQVKHPSHVQWVVTNSVWTARSVKIKVSLEHWVFIQATDKSEAREKSVKAFHNSF